MQFYLVGFCLFVLVGSFVAVLFCESFFSSNPLGQAVVSGALPPLF